MKSDFQFQSDPEKAKNYHALLTSLLLLEKKHQLGLRPFAALLSNSNQTRDHRLLDTKDLCHLISTSVSNTHCIGPIR